MTKSRGRKENRRPEACSATRPGLRPKVEFGYVPSSGLRHRNQETNLRFDNAVSHGDSVCAHPDRPAVGAGWFSEIDRRSQGRKREENTDGEKHEQT